LVTIPPKPEVAVAVTAGVGVVDAGGGCPARDGETTAFAEAETVGTGGGVTSATAPDCGGATGAALVDANVADAGADAVDG
jgi:hypothetical protein